VRVVELTAFQVRIPLRRTVRHASHTRTASDNLLVRCRLEDGTIGWGEGVPREYVTGESADFALDLLRTSDLSRLCEPCRDFSQAVQLAEHIALAPVPGDERRIRGNAARCALELAVLDAFGRHFRQSLSNITQIVAPELAAATQNVRYSGAITSSDGIKLKLISWAYRLFGFRQIKVKVGIAGQDDCRRLRAIRRRVGSAVQLRIDANEAWQPANVVEKISALEPYIIESVEQPLPHSDVSHLPAVRRQVRTPIMLDESLCGLIDAERAVNDGLCDRFNLRLSKCGGFIPTLRLAQFAKKNGLQFQLGCQVGETAILSAAGRNFASSVGGLTAVEGSFDRHLVREPLGDRDLTFGRGGCAQALTGPGLGINVDPAALARVVLRQEKLLG
jgi:muconate cycloisomerase